MAVGDTYDGRGVTEVGIPIVTVAGWVTYEGLGVMGLAVKEVPPKVTGPTKAVGCAGVTEDTLGCPNSACTIVE